MVTNVRLIAASVVATIAMVHIVLAEEWYSVGLLHMQPKITLVHGGESTVPASTWVYR